MKKINVVKNNREFNNIIELGKILKNKYFIIYYMDNKLEKYRIGISVGRKVCNAVNRNKLKRRIRNILDSNKFLCSKGKDYIIIVRKSSLNEKYNVLEENLTDLLKKVERENEK